ncbi:MAG TPA: universal stress protein [Streptosporangiaceae bacterium]
MPVRSRAAAPRRPGTAGRWRPHARRAGARPPDLHRAESRRAGSSTAPAFIEASEGCGLLVVGSRGRSGLFGGLTGSVSGHVLRHAQCPVAVVRG